MPLGNVPSFVVVVVVFIHPILTPPNRNFKVHCIRAKALGAGDE